MLDRSTTPTAPQDALGEVVIALWHQRRLALTVAAIVTALGATWALLRPLTYEVTTGISIGNRSDVGGRADGSGLIEAPEAVVGRMNEIYIPLANQAIRAKPELGSAGVRANAYLHKGGNIAIIKSVASNAQMKAHKALHASASEMLVSEHKAVTDVLASNLAKERALLQAEALAGDDINALLAKKLQIETEILALDNPGALPKRIEEIETQIKQRQGPAALISPTALDEIRNFEIANRRQDELLAIDRKQKEERAAQLRRFVEQSAAERARSAAGGKTAAEAVSIMLMDVDLQRHREELIRIERELAVLDEVAQVERNRKRSEARISTITKLYEVEGNIQAHKNKQQQTQASVEARLKDLDVRLANLKPTQVVLPTTVSDDPSERGWKALTVLFGFLGLVFGAMVALAWHRLRPTVAFIRRGG